MQDVVGAVLIAGLVVFLTGAAGWRMTYEQPLERALPVIHGDRRRRAWIHVWMMVAMPLTSGGIVALAVLWQEADAALIAAIAGVAYAMGAVCWMGSLAFRLSVVPWAAARTVAVGEVPDGFEALDRWAGVLYVVHMASAYVASAALGAAVLAGTGLPTWLGWSGIGFGVACLLGFVMTRAAGPFNPPFLAHLYTGVLGVVLLID